MPVSFHQPNGIESLKIRDFYDSFRETLKLDLVAGEKGLNKKIREKSINRPALALIGYFRYFAYRRIQLFGAGEMAYLRDLKAEEQRGVLEAIADKGIPCMVISRNLAPTRAMKDVANRRHIPLIRSPLKSKNFVTETTLQLEEHFAPRTMVHGTLLDIKGIGTLLQGKSGVGKSECALALIERGHSLVADDITYIRLLAERELMGTSSDLNRGYMECRGIGILNITELFGIRSVRPRKRVDMVIRFLEWQPGMDEERTGLEQNFVNILGLDVPLVEIPVRPGRDLARLVEVAAMVQALKAIGHDSAREFNDRLIAYMAEQAEK
ncbi:MAG: HPr(Ser) kinase/phosphatase [Opitutales bacterium]